MTSVQTGSVKRLGTYVYGDIGWIDHGGALLVTCEEDPGNIWLEVVDPLQAHSSEFDPIWEVYRVSLDASDLDWADLEAVSRYTGFDIEDLKASLASEDLKVRVGGICAIGEYYGFGELDPDHLTLDLKGVRERYPDEDPVFECSHEADLANIETRIDPDTIALIFVCKKCATKGEIDIDTADIDWQ